MTKQRLKLLNYKHEKRAGRREWRGLYQCSCGKQVIIPNFLFSKNRQRSCGCLRVEKSTKHGLSHTNEYRIYYGILQRCLNKKSDCYARYGGNGITVCRRWKVSFLNFYNDMGQRPSSGHSIDRIDNSKGYSPQNCRWATNTEQVRNSSKAKLSVEKAAEIRQLFNCGMSKKQIAEKYNIKQPTVLQIVRYETWK